MKMATTDNPALKTGNYKGTFVGKYNGNMKLQKMEGIKDRANYLSDPLKEEMDNDEIFVSGDAVVVLKYHGSYMQDNREQRKKGEEKPSINVRQPTTISRADARQRLGYKL